MDDETRPEGDTGGKTADISGDKNSSSARQEGADESIINLSDYFRVIIKQRRMIFWFCVVVVIATAIVSLFLPKYFAATTSVLPPIDVLAKEFGAGGLGGAKSDLLRKAMDVTSIADMYVGILKSRSIADAIIERFDLVKVYRVKNDFSLVRQILGRGTSIQLTDEGIINITVEDRDPCRAAAMANAYVEELDRQNKRLFVGQAASKKVFLENRLNEIQAELRNIDNIPSREARIKEMLFELLTKEFEVAKIEEAKSMPTIQILDRAVVPEKRSRPKRKHMVFLAGVTGLFVSVIGALARDRLSKMSLDDIN
jgi:tyrosine-protein kinase Etk/Wzc